MSNTVDTQPAGGTAQGTDKVLAWRVAGGSIALTVAALWASTALTGTPTAPTAAPGTNTTQLATTAFVSAAVAADGLPAADYGAFTCTGTAPVCDYDDATIAYADLANGGALSVMGRSANSSGVRADISATASSDAVFRESGGVLGWGTIQTAGYANTSVTRGKLSVAAPLVVLGNATSSGSANVTDIAATNGQYGAFRERGNALSFRRESYQALTASGTGTVTVTFTVATSPNATIANSVLAADTHVINAVSPVNGEGGRVVIVNSVASAADVPAWNLNGSATNVQELGGAEAFDANTCGITVYSWTFDGTTLFVWIEASAAPC